MCLNIIRSISVIFNASLPFLIHSFRLSIFDGRHYFGAALPSCYIVGCATNPFLIFEYTSCLCLWLGCCHWVLYRFWQYCLFWGNHGPGCPVSFGWWYKCKWWWFVIFAKYVFGSIGALAYLLGAIWAALSSVLGNWLEVYPS